MSEIFAGKEPIMATQTKERRAETKELLQPSVNGAPSQSDKPARTAWDDLKHLFGIYKDDPLARQVMDEIIANRHRDRQDDDTTD
jgi:hypothetical protein